MVSDRWRTLHKMAHRQGRRIDSSQKQSVKQGNLDFGPYLLLGLSLDRKAELAHAKVG